MLRFGKQLSALVIRQFHKTHKLPPLNELVGKINANNVSERYEEALRKFEGKIWFNSVLEVQSVRLKQFDKIISNKEKRKKTIERREIKPLPLVLNQMYDNAVSSLENKDEESDLEEPIEEPKVQDLPYTRFIKVKTAETDVLPIPVKEEDRVPHNWLQDYELYDESAEEMESTYGTPDPRVPVSDVPCSGCGAHLHCKNHSIPGYVPSELFTKVSKNDLRTIHCQRCHFLINYNTAINISVKPEDYINIISSIKDKFALAVILVDLLDFPCSIFTGLKDLLGATRPVFIVGNKVDLIPRDQPDYLNHITRCLKSEAVRMGFNEKHIKYVSLISAKTGYGVEELITQLHKIWNYRGDVYLIGCTNVGKSSLFNALLRSDFCKVEASDLVQRATACPWPGTTLKMLKFPILKTSDYRLYLRMKRLFAQQKTKNLESEYRKQQAIATKDIQYATLIGHIGMTFEEDKVVHRDPASSTHESGFAGKLFTLNENNEKYVHGKWCYDTPGVMQNDQVLQLLTTDEILKVIPNQMIRPRVFLIKPGLSLFLAGLGRLDYIDGPESTRVIVYSSLELPVSICETEDAEDFYESFLGSELLGVPMNLGEERLAKWPKLEAAHDKIVVEGEEKYLTVCDIVLSSAGWIGINLPRDTTATFKAWTPEKRGLYVRNPSLLRHGMTLRGKRVRRSLAYLIGDAFTFKKPIKGSPQRRNDDTHLELN